MRGVCRSCSGCGPRSARPRGALEPRAHEALSRPKRFIMRPNQPREPQPRRVSRHDTPHGPFFSLRAALRVRLSLRLVAPKGAVQWWASVPSRSKRRWGGGLTARAGVDVGVSVCLCFRSCDEAAGARPRGGYVAALRRRCDGQTCIFDAARATGAPILAQCGQQPPLYTPKFGNQRANSSTTSMTNRSSQVTLTVRRTQSCVNRD
jgi:hypothetical protein